MTTTPMKPGTLIKVKQEWKDPRDRDIPYMVVEDRGDKILVQELEAYANHPILGTWCWSKDWIYPIDTDIADIAEKLANKD